MSAEWLSPLVERLGWTLLHFIWQGALVGLLYGLGLFLLRDATSDRRYAVAVAVLAVLALLPPATFFYLGAAAGGLSGEAMAAPAGLVLFIGATDFAATAGPGLMLWVVAAWLAGVLVLTARLWLGWRHLVRLRRGADPTGANSLRPLIEPLCRGFGIARAVQIALSRQVRSPVVIGWLKPLILLPPAVINHLPRDQIEMVLAHELAHIRRHDHLVNLFQTVVETVLFYHPVVAWVSRRIRIERENACDDLVVRSTGDRLVYVEMLAALERMRFEGPRLALAMNDGQILGRIRRLIEPSRPRRQRGLVLPALLVVAMLSAGIGVGLVPDDHSTVPERTKIGSGQIVQRFSEEPAVPTPHVNQPPTPSASTRPAGTSTTGTGDRDAAGPDPAGRQRPATPGLASALDEAAGTQDAAATEPAGAEPTEPASLERRAEPETSGLAPPATRPAAGVSTPAGESESAQAQTDRQASSGTHAGAGLQMASRPRDPEAALRSEEPKTVAVEPAPITGGDLIRRVEPDYPGRAHRRLTDGRVELEFVVGRDGRVNDIEILQETPQRWRFGEAASAAVAQWRFEPFRRGDQPVARTVRVEVVFEPDRSTCPARTGTRIPNC